MEATDFEGVFVVITLADGDNEDCPYVLASTETYERLVDAEREERELRHTGVLPAPASSVICRLVPIDGSVL